MKDRIPQPRLYINGPCRRSISGNTFSVVSPQTGKVISRFPKCDGRDAKRAIQYAQTAFEDFRWMRATQRSAILTRWGSRIQQQKSQLASVIHLETGKPIPEAFREVESCAEYFHWFAGEAVRLYGETIPSPSGTNRHWTIREPLGVAAIITPWNFPMAMLARKLSAALAAGCTIVAKPSEKSPLSGSALLGMAVGAGLAHGVVNLVAGDAVDIVGELCANPLVRQV
ncbi:hypothetical protein XU18_3056, partial [Perkinsela sp. CCAP 1560/4]